VLLHIRLDLWAYVVERSLIECCIVVCHFPLVQFVDQIAFVNMVAIDTLLMLLAVVSIAIVHHCPISCHG